jgi:hypothetical protein
LAFLPRIVCTVDVRGVKRGGYSLTLGRERGLSKDMVLVLELELLVV